MIRVFSKMYDVILIPISDWLPQNKCQIYRNILFCSYFGDANYVGCMTVIIAAVLLMMMLPQQQKQQLHVLLLLLLLPILLYYYYYYFLFKRRLFMGYFTHRFCIKVFSKIYAWHHLDSAFWLVGTTQISFLMHEYAL